MTGARPRDDVGVVAIGRNEGERLAACLAAVAGSAGQVVYVDSGSTDGSIGRADAMGVVVVELDRRMPYSAARARNAGFRRWRQLAPHGRYLQFADGDCEMAAGWLERAAAFLDAHPDVAVVYGRLRERHPDRSVYNLLRDMEHDVPVGLARGCGGNAMMRADAFEAVGGYRDDLICGEEPELCIRLRAAGWRVWHLDAPMAMHDAAMTRFSQWWRRAVRAGYGVALGADLHGGPPEYHSMREWYRTWVWGLGIPGAAAALALWSLPAALVLLAAYPLQVFRIAMLGQRRARANWWRALFLVLSLFPGVLGQLKYLVHRLLRRQSRLIEYK
ncbi:MAG TPA: glycosyltransferase family A protein [Steroidobacteraceae bacterium]|jgi:GT2 family glycosyltransferase